MGLHEEQLGKDSKRFVIITPAQKKEIKRQNTRKKRRKSKNIDNPNPKKYRSGYCK